MKFVRKRAQKFISHTAVTVNEGQGHSNWYQTVRFGGFFHLAKFKKLVCKCPYASQRSVPCLFARLFVCTKSPNFDALP